MKRKILVSKTVPPSIKYGGHYYRLTWMLMFEDSIKEAKAQLRRDSIKYRTVLYRHPKEKVVNTLFYTRK